MRARCTRSMKREYTTMRPDISKYNLMLITDRHRSLGRDNASVIRDALTGGVRLFQLREPDLPDGEIFEFASAILPGIRSTGGILILNDRIDVCLACDADGVHLGANDLPIVPARKVIGDSKLIGFSAHTREQALNAASDGADYITLSPAFPLKHKESPFKPHTPDELWAITNELDIPVFFLGGITMKNLPELLHPERKTRIAVVSAITGSEDIAGASDKLLNILE